MVDLQTAIEELNTGKIEFDYKDDDCCTTEGEVVILLKRLAELETADVVEVKHGYWKQNPCCERFYYCSECNERIEDATKMPYVNFPYCHCGAKMDGGKEE